MADEENNIEENGRGSGGSVLHALKTKELLLPAALSAVGAVAAAKGPDLVRRLTDATEEKGEDTAQRLGKKAAEGAASDLKDKAKGMGVVGKVASKVLPGGGGGGGGGKKTRRLPIQRWTDVAVPVDKAYDAWIKFDQYPKFMHRVLSVEQKEGDKVSWQEKIWFSKRQWEGKITERRKNDRIVWKTTQGTSHKGIVSFHRIDDNLTRVMVEMEFQPTGMMEKMASGLRFVKRAVQADLARFKAYVEMSDAKGLDYAPVKDEKDDKDDKDDEQRDRNGDRSAKSEGERENDRSEREGRRRERQKSGATS
jgi:Polyketide cyclase / dehydrase and lipid transport